MILMYGLLIGFGILVGLGLLVVFWVFYCCAVAGMALDESRQDLSA